MRENNFALLVSLVLALSLCGHSADKVARNPPPAAQDLALKVSPTKLVYKTSEAIELHLTLENKGQAQQIVPRHLKLRTNIRLQILDHQGGSAKWCGRIADELVFLKSNYRTLSPGEFLKGRLTISCQNAEDPGRSWGYKISVPGKYTIEAAYQLTLPRENYEKGFPGARVVSGPVSAEPVTIELQ
ncbi:MAG: hypothetical protein JWN74_1880 [Acidobacteriaceae bacterium]|nr:hypothetical protein [Acidobacteriaceae bacterium]